MSNRIIAGGVPEPEELYGRHHVIKYIWEQLSDNNIFLVAPRRFGKTGVMNNLLKRPQTGYLDAYRKARKRGASSLEFDEIMADLVDERERHVQLSRLAEGMFDAGHTTEAARLLAEFEAPSATSESSYQSAGYRALGDRLSNKKEVVKAIEAYTEALKKDPQNVEARLRLGLALSTSGNHEKARTEFDVVANTPGISKDILAQVLVNRGITKGQLGDRQGEIADYTAVVELSGAPSEQVAGALVNRGVTRGQLGDSRGEIADYTAVLELATAPTEQVAKAFVLLTGKLLQDDRLQDAANLMAKLHEIEPAETPLARRLETRISVIVSSARKHSLDAAATLLASAMMHDPDEIRDRLGFLRPAIEFARTGREQALANLPDRERDAAREIAATFLEKDDRNDKEDPAVGTR